MVKAGVGPALPDCFKSSLSGPRFFPDFSAIIKKSLMVIGTTHKQEDMFMSRQTSAHYLGLKNRHPELISAVEAMCKAAHNAGPLDEKTVQLIQLGAAAAIGSKGSLRSHAQRAMEAGATSDEVYHAIIVLTSTIGFPTVAAALARIDEVVG